MNSDEITALVTKLVTLGFGVVGRGGWRKSAGSQSQAIAAGAGALAGVLFGVYLKWNQRNVPEKSVVTYSATTVARAKELSAPAVEAAK